jgi:hypothetical protein
MVFKEAVYRKYITSMTEKRNDFGKQKTSTQANSCLDLRSFANYGQTAAGNAVSDRNASLATNC